jgi:exopolysaccharide biosynthesis polyprenyl glycosylphosphotransferase
MNGSILSSARRSLSAESYFKAIYRFLLLVADSLSLAAAMRLAYWIRFELKISVAPGVVPIVDFYQSLTFVIACGCIMLFTFAGLYNWNRLIGGTLEYARAFNACSIAFLLLVLATYTFQTFNVSRVFLAASWIFSVLFVLGARFSLRRIPYALRNRGYFRTRAAVVGTSGESITLIKELRDPDSGYEIVGLIGINGDAVENPSDCQIPPFLGTVKNLDAIVEKLRITELVVPSSSFHREDLIKLHKEINKIPRLELRLATGLFELLTTGVQIRTAGVVPLICLKKLRLSLAELCIKTLVEYLITTAGLIFLLPLFGLIALGIKLDSPGPVFYRRRVLGVGGKQFDAFKFRTMRADSDKILREHPELAAQLQEEEKLKVDPRITRFGKWLRKYSVDELPQLINVLKGQMSLVGPRMISPPEAEKYSSHQFNLLTVKPGLTGLWQVSGRSDLSYEERIRLDMYYIRNYTIWSDFYILFIKTAHAVLKGRGAY